MVIRNIRNEHGIKRATLAIDANVSEKTIERAESGERIQDDSYRKIARALRIDETLLVGEVFVTDTHSLELLKRQAETELEELNTRVTVRRICDPRDVTPLFRGDVTYAMDHDVDKDHLQHFESLKQSFVDWADVTQMAAEVNRVEVAENVIREVQDFEKLGYVVKAGMSETTVIGPFAGAKPVRCVVAVLAAFRQPGNARDNTASEVWIPKRAPAPL
jgi:transcriptional regulator with XRE-family HTH domain